MYVSFAGERLVMRTPRLVPVRAKNVILSLSDWETADVFRFGGSTTPASVNRSVGLAQRRLSSAFVRLAGTVTACGFAWPGAVNVSVVVWVEDTEPPVPKQSAPPMLTVANVPSKVASGPRLPNTFVPALGKGAMHDGT